MALSDVDLAWAAAWISADGSITNAGDGRPRVKFSLTDRDPLDKMAALFGGSVAGPRAQHVRALGSKPLYDWQISGRGAVNLLQLVMPWLSERYVAKASGFLSYDPDGGRALTRADVARIRSALREGKRGTGRRLAKQYGVSEGLISAIKHGRTWKEVA